MMTWCVVVWWELVVLWDIRGHLHVLLCLQNEGLILTGMLCVWARYICAEDTPLTLMLCAYVWGGCTLIGVQIHAHVYTVDVFWSTLKLSLTQIADFFDDAQHFWEALIFICFLKRHKSDYWPDDFLMAFKFLREFEAHAHETRNKVRLKNSCVAEQCTVSFRFIYTVVADGESHKYYRSALLYSAALYE